MIEKYLNVLDLKDVKRTGWKIYNVEDPEEVASHSWSVATLVMVHMPDNLNELKALKMALIHDIGESEIGDYPYRADAGHESKDKQEDELKAVKEISRALDQEEILDLYREYAGRSTDEAKFVKDMDLIDMVLQALKYEEQNRYKGNENTDYEGLNEFFETSRPRFNTEKGREMFKEIESKYRSVKNNR